MATKKLEILSSVKDDESSVTFCLYEEDHTLGNALRHLIIRNPDVEFCGYSLPHPSEDKIHLRIQTKGKSAIQALEKGLTDLSDVCSHILDLIDQELPSAKLPDPPAEEATMDEDAEVEVDQTEMDTS